MIYMDCPACGAEGVEISGVFVPAVPPSQLQPGEPMTFIDIHCQHGCQLDGYDEPRRLLLAEEGI